MQEPAANPYQTPVPEAAPLAQVLKNPRGFALASCWLLAVATLAGVAVHLAEILVPYEIINDVESLPFIGYTLAALAWLVAYFAAVTLFLFWKYRAAANARILDPLAISVSPGLAVGGYFIPFANLYIPYRAMSGIARASFGASILPGLWWTLHLVNSFVSFGVLGEQLDTVEILPPGDLAHVGTVCDIIAATVSIYLVMKITRAQSARLPRSSGSSSK